MEWGRLFIQVTERELVKGFLLFADDRIDLVFSPVSIQRNRMRLCAACYFSGL